MKMELSWISYIVFLLCYCAHLQVVLAGKKAVEQRKLSNWKDFSGSQGGSVNNWDDYYENQTQLGTTVCGGCSSWFTTPSLKLPTTSYLAIEASCDMQPCQFQINGTSSSSALGPYELIQTVTYENRSSKTITIKKPYSYLRINALNIESQKKMFQIFSMEMYHYFCDKTTKFNTNMKKVDSSTSNISNLVQCFDHAIASDGNSTSITVTCTPKGKWIAREQKCVCNKGFYFDSKQCSFCPIDTYKNAVGNAMCTRCPHGKTNTTMNTECECKEDYYVREKDDGKCYAVPLGVQKLKIRSRSNTSVQITWDKPQNDDGFNGSFTYTVECYRCTNNNKPRCDIFEKNATYFPARTDLETTRVIISNLTFNGTYKFKVYSMSGLKNVSYNKWKFEQETFTLTYTAPPKTTFPPKTSQATTNDNATDDKESGTEWYIIVIVLISGIIVGILLSYIVQCSRRRWFGNKKPKRKPDQQPTEVNSTYQELDPSKMNKKDNYQSLRGNVARINEATNVDDTENYTELSKTRDVENNYQSLT